MTAKAAARYARLETALRGRGAPADGDRVRTTAELAEFAAGGRSAPATTSSCCRRSAAESSTLSPVVALVALAQPDVQETLLADPDWTTVDQLRTLAAGGDAEAATLLAPLDEALRFDEHAAPLEPKLRRVRPRGPAADRPAA